MKIFDHPNYVDYVSAQTAANYRKLDWVAASEREMRLIASYVRAHIPKPSLGICHGVRNGWEVARLRDYLGIEIIGTEISDTAVQFANVIQWDFHDVKDDWIGNTDFIYTNAWDHSHRPQHALDQWMRCLKPDGRCFIQWTRNHDQGFSASDCFAASLEEYREVIGEKYVIERILNARSARDRVRDFMHRLQARPDGRRFVVVVAGSAGNHTT